MLLPRRGKGVLGSVAPRCPSDGHWARLGAVPIRTAALHPAGGPQRAHGGAACDRGEAERVRVSEKEEASVLLADAPTFSLPLK